MSGACHLNFAFKQTMKSQLSPSPNILTYFRMDCSVKTTLTNVIGDQWLENNYIDEIKSGSKKISL